MSVTVRHISMNGLSSYLYGIIYMINVLIDMNYMDIFYVYIYDIILECDFFQVYYVYHRMVFLNLQFYMEILIHYMIYNLVYNMPNINYKLIITYKTIPYFGI